jgi:RND family efflux transporter MFP subunit
MSIYSRIRLCFCMLINKNELQFLMLKVFLVAFSIMPIATLAAQEATLVRPIKIGYYEFYEKFTAIGQCKSENSKTYYAKAAGTINSIAIVQDKNVSAGDVLITIDADMAEVTKSKAEAAFESAKMTYDRDMSLLEKKIISSEVSNRSKVALEIARADLVAARNKYEDMVITAPYGGYVGVVNARIGDDVKMGDYLFSLVAKGDKTVFVELPEIMHSRIDQNSSIYVSDVGGSKIQGQVIAVSDYLNDNGTITAKLAFPSSSKLVHGSYVEVEMIFDQHKALAVPEKVLLKNNQGNFVYKISEENKVQQVYITTGTRTDRMIEVISGELQVGDLIVLNGLTKVYDGALVAIIDDSPDSKQPKSGI